MEYVTLESIVTRITTEHSDKSANTKLILSESVDDAMDARQSGLLTGIDLDTDEMARKFLHNHIQKQLKSASKRIRANTTGQYPLDLGTDYDLTFTVCGSSALAAVTGQQVTSGRTTTLGLHTADDWRLIDMEESIQLERAQKSYDDNHPVYQERRNGLFGFANYRSFMEQRATA